MADPGLHRDKRQRAVTGIQMDESMLKKCDAALKTVTRRQSAVAFSEPVNWRALNLPDYPKIVKQPMDLGTVQDNLTNHRYAFLEEFANDIRLVWKNAMLFNAPDSAYFKNAKQLCEVAEKKMGELEQEGIGTLPPLDPPVRCELVLSEIMRHPMCEWFIQPVDVEGLGLTDYRSVVDRSMDLTTVQRQLKADRYTTVESFAADVKLTFDNCIKYNGANSMFGVVAALVSQAFERKCTTYISLGAQHPPRTGQPVPDREGWPSFSQKKKFYDACTKLSLVDLNHIVKLVHKSCSGALQHNGDKEVELDVDNLDMETFKKVFNYAKQQIQKLEPAS
ncbi:Bromodomain-containing protein [Pavlovales sp. CCMP2436]|nr:Bromodomain-containing protein [Pavlovales sp. CCMP2436]|mmetsp:Transcript_26602/g.65693  ORF Transcript_26602/g.65693 Transcript_26602/m.65693 type:complete len:335 (+) Transcript_26602:115-1119(+)